jgi:hypothetical protein
MLLYVIRRLKTEAFYHLRISVFRTDRATLAACVDCVFSLPAQTSLNTDWRHSGVDASVLRGILCHKEWDVVLLYTEEFEDSLKGKSDEEKERKKIKLKTA